MIVLLIETDGRRADVLTRAFQAARCRVAPVTSADDVRRAVVGVPPADVVALTAGTPGDAARAARESGLPLVLVEDGRAVPSAVLRTEPVAVLSAATPPESLAARLEIAVERRAAAVEAVRSHVALGAAAAAILVVDGDGRVLRANAAFARIGGGAPRDPRGTNLVDLLLPAGDDAARERFARAAQGRAEFTGDATLLGGGTRVPVRVGVAPLARSGEAVAGSVAVLLDLSDHLALEESLREANRMLAQQAFVDPLTTLFNRAYLHDALEREVARARRYGTPLSVLMIDLDGFKRVNDVWGHGAGDEVLRAVARELRAAVRDADVLTRYGGDEFCVLLPNTDADAARLAADRIRDRVRGMAVGPDGATRLGATCGLATNADLDLDHGPDALVFLADGALMVAKRAGGDRVLSADSVEVRTSAGGDLRHGLVEGLVQDAAPDAPPARPRRADA